MQSRKALSAVRELLSAQTYNMRIKLEALAHSRNFEIPDSYDSPPSHARTFDYVTPFPNQGGFVNYPAAGAGPVTILSYAVPKGFEAFVGYLAIVHIGGGYVNGSGNIIWRVFVNNGAQQGLNDIESQIASLEQPNRIPIHLAQTDTLTITVEVPAGAVQPPPLGATTAARIRGWAYLAGSKPKRGFSL